MTGIPLFDVKPVCNMTISRQRQWSGAEKQGVPTAKTAWKTDNVCPFFIAPFFTSLHNGPKFYRRDPSTKEGLDKPISSGQTVTTP
jgi:hypothetical protein